MAEGESHEGYTPEQLEAEKSRALSDAKLIKGGAEYTNVDGGHILEPTKDQQEKIGIDKEINDVIDALESNAKSEKNADAFFYVFLNSRPGMMGLKPDTIDNIFQALREAYESDFSEGSFSNHLREALLEELKTEKGEKKPDLGLTRFLNHHVIYRHGSRDRIVFPEEKNKS